MDLEILDIGGLSEKLPGRHVLWKAFSYDG
jgi:hypothetical protein